MKGTLRITLTGDLSYWVDELHDRGVVQCKYGYLKKADFVVGMLWVFKHVFGDDIPVTPDEFSAWTSRIEKVLKFYVSEEGGAK